MLFDLAHFSLLLFAGFVAGCINAIAGGGPLITLPVLIFSGLDARLANLTSTAALLPGQIAAGYGARGALISTGGIEVGPLVAINVVGGAAGALLLLTTPSSLFTELVPWLVLMATVIYAWSNFGLSKHTQAARLGPIGFVVAQILVSIYGGYFGGGNSFIMLALLAVTGLAAREAGRLKNLLIAFINMAAAAVFLLSSAVAYDKAIPMGVGAFVGSIVGASFLHRLDEAILKIIVVTIGAVLTIWLFWSA